MPITVDNSNTTVTDLNNGWIKVVHSSGQTAVLPRAIIELSEGVLLDSATSAAVLETELNSQASPAETDVTAAVLS